MWNMSEYTYIIRKLNISSDGAKGRVYNDGVKNDKEQFGYGLFA